MAYSRKSRRSDVVRFAVNSKIHNWYAGTSCYLAVCLHCVSDVYSFTMNISLRYVRTAATKSLKSLVSLAQSKRVDLRASRNESKADGACYRLEYACL